VSTLFDVAIVGGGMVGGSLACALSGHGLRVVLVEAHVLSADQQPGYDDRTVALAYGSRRIFQGLGLWQAMAADACAIEKIHVSERGGWGFARLDAKSQAVPALGYVTPARSIGHALAGRLDKLGDVDLLSPARLTTLTRTGSCMSLGIDRGDETVQLDARLLVAADGTNSRVRELLGVKATERAYGQMAVTANISPEEPHRHVAFERFSLDGPMALLPMTENRCALVYTVQDGAEHELLALDDEAFMERVQQRFGFRLGRFIQVGRRNAHSLTMLRSHEHARPGVAIIGNAAHALHPVAGQGFNLGLRDVAALAEVVVSAHRNGEAIGGMSVLERYARWRRGDQVRTLGFTDALVRLFGNPLPPIRLARELGLLAFDRLPAAKRLFGRNAMGIGDTQPKLARGVPL